MFELSTTVIPTYTASFVVVYGYLLRPYSRYFDFYMTRAAPTYWKFRHVCHSSGDSETLNLLKKVEDFVFVI